MTVDEGIGEMYAAIKELRSLQQNLTIRIKDLEAKITRASEEQYAFERRVVAAGRVQWSDAIAIPDQPALEQAHLAIDTRKCSACGQRQSRTLMDGRLNAKYMRTAIPYEYTICQSCKSSFI